MTKFYLPIMPAPFSPKSNSEWVGDGELYGEVYSIAADIKSGQIDPAPDRVIEVDETAGTVRDVTREVAVVIGEHTIADGEEPDAALQSWLRSHGAEYYQDGDGDVYDMRREHSTLSRQMQL